MNKKQLTDKIYDMLTAFPSTGYYKTVTWKDTAGMVGSIFDQIRDEVARGERVSIGRFGIFEGFKTKSRTITNQKIRGGEPMQVAPKTVPKFRPSKTFKRRVN